MPLPTLAVTLSAAIRAPPPLLFPAHGQVLDLGRSRVGGDLSGLAKLERLRSLQLGHLPRLQGPLFPALLRLRRLADLDLQVAKRYSKRY